MKDYSKLYAIIFWLSLLSILVWLILKVLGIINTPLWLELFPLFSAIFGAGAFFQMSFDMRKRLSKLENRTEKIASGLTTVEFDIKYIKKEMQNLGKEL